MNDWTLLHEYIANRSEPAFAELVNRHIQMVYGTALRQVRASHAAEDVTQAVFILFARKAPSISSSVVIGGWLYRTACLVSMRFLRDEKRREAKERQSAVMLNEHNSEEQLWEQIAPHLDDALSRLNPIDRDSIVLRYIQQRSFREVSEALRMGEDAAKKRVARALEKLRATIAARGVPVTAAGLAAHLAASAQAIPAAGLAALCAGNALSQGPITSTTVEAILQGIARDGWMPPVKWTASIAIIGLVLVMAVWQVTRPNAPVQERGDVRPAIVATLASESELAVIPAENTNSTRTMVLRVVAAESGAPLVGAKVTATFHSSSNSRFAAVTDSDGTTRAELPPEADFAGMSFWVGTEGRVPINIDWREHEARSLPREYTVRLTAGHRLVGRVVDEQGSGVANAKLFFNGEGIEWNSRETVSYSTDSSRPISDANGYWEGSFFSPNLEWIAGRAEHPDFAITTFSKSLNVHEPTNHVFVLQRGMTLSGVVRDSEGNPISNAQIDLQDLSGWRSQRKGAADANGEFSLDRIAEGRFRLRASAVDFKPADIVIPFTTQGTNVQVTLQPVAKAGDAVLRGRVVDARGRAAIWAQVGVVATDRGTPPIWTASVDRDGKFEWRSAPEGTISLFVSGGNSGALAVELLADGIEHEIRLPAQAKIRISGTVIDAESGQPVPVAKLMLKPAPEAAGIPSQPEWLGEAYDGKFEFVIEARKLDSPAMRHGLPMGGGESTKPALLAEGPGYRRASIDLPAGTNNVEIVVRLDRGGAVQGRVFFANQLPAAGAELGFGTKLARAFMNTPAVFAKSHDPNLQKRALAAHNGSFDLGEAPFNAERVLAVHEHGWANVSIKSVPDEPITLEPWSRVEGYVRVARKPGETLQVLISGDSESPASMGFDFYAELDAAGRFVFEKVPAGAAKISLMHRRSKIGLFSHVQSILVPAGGTNVVIGGKGVQVTGRIIPSSPRTDIDWDRSGQHLQVQEPPTFRGLRAQSYGFFCDADGRFRIEGVLPGEYRLVLAMVAAQQRVDQFGNELDDHLGRMVKDITIGAEDVDLGEMTVAVKTKEPGATEAQVRFIQP